jgi:hypothetical protein
LIFQFPVAQRVLLEQQALLVRMGLMVQQVLLDLKAQRVQQAQQALLVHRVLQVLMVPTAALTLF